MHRLEKMLSELETTITQGIQEGIFPGATLWIGWHGETIKCAAYGKTADKVYGAYKPIPTTTKTIYDLASLTKVVATTNAVLQLRVWKVLSLIDPIAKYIPQFGTDQQKAGITIQHILTHTSGLPNAVRLFEHYHGERQIIEEICHQKLVFAPGANCLYTDLGFILLGEIVWIISSLRLDEFTQRYVFNPLEMADTMFAPPESLKARIAPTECVGWRGGVIHGEVHDENAWAMGGIAGHAGLFSTVEDLARFCTMILNQGMYKGESILNTGSISDMETIYSSNSEESYGLGWVINAPYFMGDLASKGTLGHTGFTGTSILLKPMHHLAVVFLSNRIYPTREGPLLNPYRRRVANIVAEFCQC
jgi:CubicO group peptidase (beta-lactamase class C family)